MLYLGVDIGGTNCSVALGEVRDSSVRILEKGSIRITAQHSASTMLDILAGDMLEITAKFSNNNRKISGIGISCGGPLNSQRGIILSPPNLIGWDNVKIVDFFEKETGLPAWLCNDANASALAEWKFGAGKGLSNVLFLTFGTGLGAGLILDSRLYTGTNDMAGEVGHVRLENFGPTGYGKSGSFEGFCSGGGIAQLAKLMVLEELQKGSKPALCPEISELDSLTAKKVSEFASAKDPLAAKILSTVGTQLGKGLSLLIDILNPEMIIIGSIFTRAYDYIWPATEAVIIAESLALTQKVCRVSPSFLKESIGDVAAITVAHYYSNIKED